MKNFFHDKKGETLVEVLAAILIFTLSSIILYSMVTTASRVNLKAKEFDKANYDQILITERGQTPSGEGNARINHLKDDAKNEIYSGKVNIFKTEDENSLISYYKKPAGH